MTEDHQPQIPFEVKVVVVAVALLFIAVRCLSTVSDRLKDRTERGQAAVTPMWIYYSIGVLLAAIVIWEVLGHV